MAAFKHQLRLQDVAKIFTLTSRLARASIIEHTQQSKPKQTTHFCPAQSNAGLPCQARPHTPSARQARRKLMRYLHNAEMD